MEACPRRWMLSRAKYPELWNRHGYPGLPVVSALFGNVVHGVIEQLAQALADSGMDRVTPGAVVSVLGDLGGWNHIVLEQIEKQLAGFMDNPRVSAARIERVRDELIRRAPQAVDQVKVFLRRGALPTSQRRPNTETVNLPNRETHRFPVSLGAHSEYEVSAEVLRLTGRIDLLLVDDDSVTIIDYKTGEEAASHDDQVRIYALLWDLDDTVNPNRRLATRLEVAYPSHNRSVEPLDSKGLRELELSVIDRIAAADAFSTFAEPIAKPSPQTCQFCTVKHLCDAYWRNVPPAISEVTPEEWFDFEGSVLTPQGTRSWYFEASDTSDQVLVRTIDTNVAFPVGDRVRLLGVRRTIDPDDQDRFVVSMVRTSEWYSVST